MPILNYTTEIKSDRTVGEIQAILARAGARTVHKERSVRRVQKSAQ